MNAWPKQDTDSMNAFYGDPDGDNGLPDPDFEAQNLTTIIPPYPMTFSWNTTVVSHIRVNKKCSAALLAALQQIGRDFTIAERQKYQLDRFGGCYNFRLMRGLNTLSIHSWGAAIDLATAINVLGDAPGSKPDMMPQRAIYIFAAQGATWGGVWHRPDAQHFQFANV